MNSPIILSSSSSSVSSISSVTSDEYLIINEDDYDSIGISDDEIEDERTLINYDETDDDEDNNDINTNIDDLYIDDEIIHDNNNNCNDSSDDDKSEENGNDKIQHLPPNLVLKTPIAFDKNKKGNNDNNSNIEDAICDNIGGNHKESLKDSQIPCMVTVTAQNDMPATINLASKADNATKPSTTKTNHTSVNRINDVGNVDDTYPFEKVGHLKNITSGSNNTPKTPAHNGMPNIEHNTMHSSESKDYNNDSITLKHGNKTQNISSDMNDFPAQKNTNGNISSSSSSKDNNNIINNNSNISNNNNDNGVNFILRHANSVHPNTQNKNGPATDTKINTLPKREHESRLQTKSAIMVDDKKKLNGIAIEQNDDHVDHGKISTPKRSRKQTNDFVTSSPLPSPTKPKKIMTFVTENTLPNVPAHVPLYEGNDEDTVQRRPNFINKHGRVPNDETHVSIDNDTEVSKPGGVLVNTVYYEENEPPHHSTPKALNKAKQKFQRFPKTSFSDQTVETDDEPLNPFENNDNDIEQQNKSLLSVDDNGDESDCGSGISFGSKRSNLKRIENSNSNSKNGRESSQRINSLKKIDPTANRISEERCQSGNVFFYTGSEPDVANPQNGYIPNDSTYQEDKSFQNDQDQLFLDDDVTGKRQTKVLRERLFTILSGLYGILVVLVGAVVPITDVFLPPDVHYHFEVFYIYLYGVSLLFLIYVYAYLLRRNRFRSVTSYSSVVWVRQLTRALSRSDRPSENKSKNTKRTISLDMTNHHTGTFYLRLGVLGFGMGSMIHCGLQFGSYFSLTGDCSRPLAMVKPLLHMIFAFFQLYFIFMNSKMCIHRYKKLARFGLMHMCATNICVWFRAIVVETIHVINSYHRRKNEVDVVPTATPTRLHSYDHINVFKKAGGDDVGYDVIINNTSSGGGGHDVKDVSGGYHHVGTHRHSDDSNPSCFMSKIMLKAADQAGPYLYPCTIEYSLMCACILYIMWKNVGQRNIHQCQSTVDVGGDDNADANDDDKRRVHRMSVDCTSSSRGLFVGILTIVGSIISIIAFYMMVREPGLKHKAFVLTHVSETAVYILTLIALIKACWLMRNFTFKEHQEAGLEDILIIISYTGLVAFIVFSLMASIILETHLANVLNIVSNSTMLMQATLQTIFMLAGDRMSAANIQQRKRKPGREYVTFMLISNFAMWAINTFETQTPEHNPMQVEVYGIEAWAIFTHVSVPLGIYYRFHSTVCMSNIWKNAWKLKKHV